MTARITLALLFIIPAAMAYPWPSTHDRWLLGVAVVAAVVLFSWWRGLFLTTVVGRRIAMLLRRNGKAKDSGSSESTTVLMRVDARELTGLPLHLIAGYLDRYGIRCDKVRVTTRDAGGPRTTWIGLTLSAADNLTALQARSPRIPLHDTAEVVARRLADHLREAGWSVSLVDSADVPAPSSARETWRGVRDDLGYVAAYDVKVDDRLANTLAEIRALPSQDTWTALEFTGVATKPSVSAVCALRTTERPAAAAPIPALQPLRGRHRAALTALDPLSTERLHALTGT
jgi:type VII secretion protein EccE